LAQFDAVYGAKEFKVAAAEPVGICDAIAGETLFQVASFADVKDLIEMIAHEVNAGRLRSVTKEGGAETINERARIWKK
jgi:hypothetical protein